MADPRGTRRWRQLRAAILATSDICGHCGQPGADTVDHIIPVDLRPDLAMDPTNLRPMHGRKRDGCPGNYSTGATHGNRKRNRTPILRPNPSRRWI